MLEGKKYYRVTSILGLLFPSEVQLPEKLLTQYASRGTLLHADASEMLNGVVNLAERREALKTLEGGSLKMQPINKQVLKDFMLKYPEYDWKSPAIVEKTIWNDDLQLVGTPDVIMMKRGKICLCDWKTTSNYPESVKNKYFMQMAIYALLWELQGHAKIDELHIFPIKPKNKYGYGAPYITTDIKKYQDMYLDKYLKLNPKAKWQATRNG